LGAISAESAPTIPVEYQVKAAFIGNFIQFTEWPEGVLGGNVVISILGDSPLVEALKSIEDMQVKGRRISIRPIRTLQDLGSSHILFFAASEKNRVDEVLLALKKRNILTIGEVDGFCRKGGIINFILNENKVRFEINAESARDAGLTISSKVLKLATIVQTAQEGN
jgi:hypothetical protein